MEKSGARVFAGVLALAAGLALLFGGGAEQAEASGPEVAVAVQAATAAYPVPYARLTYPQNDGGIFICPPPKFGPIQVLSGEVNTRTVLIQVRENEGAVRVGGARTSARAGFKKGTQLKSRETITLDVSSGSPAYCVAEADSDAGTIIDVTFGVAP